MERKAIQPSPLDKELFKVEDEYTTTLKDDVRVMISAFHVVNKFIRNHPNLPFVMAAEDKDGETRHYDVKEAVPSIIANVATRLVSELNDIGEKAASEDIIGSCNTKYGTSPKSS